MTRVRGDDELMELLGMMGGVDPKEEKVATTKAGAGVRCANHMLTVPREILCLGCGRLGCELVFNLLLVHDTAAHQVLVLWVYCSSHICFPLHHSNHDNSGRRRCCGPFVVYTTAILVDYTKSFVKYRRTCRPTPTRR